LRVHQAITRIALGSAPSRAFAREGATLSRSSRHLKTVDAVAKEIVAEGDKTEAVVVDALGRGPARTLAR